jgi:glycosyltransferase involved in cell wall biosynthesis
MNGPSVSVLCLSYNHEHYIESALQGFIAQKTTFPVEFLIGDDASKDSTRDIIAKYAALDSRIKPFYREKNMGPVPNCYDLMNRIDSMYVAVCDGDDYWTDPLKLQKQVDYMEGNLQCSLCFHRITELSQSTGETRSPDVKDFISEESREFGVFSYRDLVSCNFIGSVSVVWRWPFKKGYVPTDFLKNRFLGDYPIHLITALNGTIDYLPDDMAVYRKHSFGVWSLQVNRKARLNQAKEILNAYWMALDRASPVHTKPLLDRIKAIYDDADLFLWPRLKRKLRASVALIRTALRS